MCNLRCILILLSLLILSACEGAQMGKREVGALGGAGLGAGLGAIVGHKVGHTGAGIAIGSGLGALSGAAVGHQYDVADAALSEQDSRLEQRARELEENRILIEQLKSRGADARSTDRGVVVNLPDVLFNFDSANLTADARQTTRHISDVVRNIEGRRILVEGHTDSIGTREYNQRLSENRARAVGDALLADGVPRNKVFTRGFGFDDPVASNQTDLGRAMNRRVEVVIENR